MNSKFCFTIIRLIFRFCRIFAILLILDNHVTWYFFYIFDWNLNIKISHKIDGIIFQILTRIYIYHFISFFQQWILWCGRIVNLKTLILKDFIFYRVFLLSNFSNICMSESFKRYCMWTARNLVYTIDFQQSVLLWWFSYVLYLAKGQFVRAFCLIKGKYLKRPMAF